METHVTQNSQNDVDKSSTKLKDSYFQFKTLWYWHKDGHIGQWNRTESPEINPYIQGQVISHMGTRTIHWGKNSLYDKRCWDNLIAIGKRIKVNELSETNIKQTKKWIKDQHVKATIIKLFKENRTNPCYPELGHACLDRH